MNWLQNVLTESEKMQKGGIENQDTVWEFVPLNVKFEIKSLKKEFIKH